MNSMKNPPPGRPDDGLPKTVCLAADFQDPTKSPAPRQDNFGANVGLAEIKRDSIWRLCRTAGEHLDRLLWAIDREDDAGLRRQCQALVAHVRVVAILVNDLTGGGAA